MKRSLRTAALLGAFLTGLVSCKKEEDKKTTTPKPESPYYFDFTFGGEHNRFACPFGQWSYMSGGVGGFQQPSENVFYPDIELSFVFNKEATDADVKGLAGHRYRFNSWDKIDETTAFMSYNTGVVGGSWMDTDDSTWNYYVDVSKVTFVKVDTAFGTPLDIYEVTGTCKTMMEDDAGTNKKMLEGSFNMLISRIKK